VTAEPPQITGCPCAHQPGRRNNEYCTYSFLRKAAKANITFRD
jgi:hypothetical protein